MNVVVHYSIIECVWGSRLILGLIFHLMRGNGSQEQTYSVSVSGVCWLDCAQLPVSLLGYIELFATLLKKCALFQNSVNTTSYSVGTIYV